MSSLPKKPLKILVDMSATILHHGHIRILKKAKEYGHVIVALTTDEEILKKKGYLPELEFQHRKEILLSIRHVDEVIPSPWLIDESFFLSTGADYLLHGNDNTNILPEKFLRLTQRTSEISSTEIRKKAAQIYLRRTPHESKMD